MSEYIRSVVASSVQHFANPQSGNSRRMMELARQFLPYALFRRADGRLLVLNREFKPLGWPPKHRERVDYEDADLRLLTIDGSHIPLDPAGERMTTLWAAEQAPWRTQAAANAYRTRVAQVFGLPAEFGANDMRAAA